MVGSKYGPKKMGLPGYYDEHRHWQPPGPDLLDDADRVMPETVPNEYLYSHRVGCQCEPCKRYPYPEALADKKVRWSARRRG